jgi:DNA-binding NtrC family response regulator
MTQQRTTSTGGRAGAMIAYAVPVRRSSIRAEVPRRPLIMPSLGTSARRQITPRGYTLTLMSRILVIDDEEDVLRAVRRRLEREGYSVDAANSSQEGIEQISRSEQPYDVIVTDMSMEDPDSGLRVLQAAFARDLFAEVVVMTAYGNVANAVECMRRGAFDYIEKNTPGVDAYEMLALKIEQALERRRRDVQTVALWERAAKSKERVGN